MSTTTFQGGLANRGTKGASKASVLCAVVATMDPTNESAQATGKILPKGCTPVTYVGYGGATGGTTPAFNVGTSTDDNAFIVQERSDLYIGFDPAVSSGALLGTELTEDTEIYASAATSDASTGGSTTFAIFYTMPV